MNFMMSILALFLIVIKNIEKLLTNFLGQNANIF